MKLKDIKSLFHKDLDAIYGKKEVSSFFFLCIEHFYMISRLQLALNTGLIITKQEQDSIFNALNRLKKQEPIQYILGKTTFYGLPFLVEKSTLIPRPETEELVTYIIKNNKNQQQEISVLDIGTGTGCIAIALAKNLKKATVYALDVSAEAIKIAKHNAQKNNIIINFIELNILEEQLWHTQFKGMVFDVIVSNPPYVRHLEKAKMQPNVLNYEPHLALFVEDQNPLLFYNAITKFAMQYLDENGKLYFEINEYLAEQTKQLVEKYNFKNARILKDIFNKNRILIAEK